MSEHFDYIVVGAGSAGSALAGRLARLSDKRVLLLEAGSAARNPMIHIPLGFAFLLKEHANNWGYTTQPEPGLGGRCVELPRGKVLGGCSAINGMVYVRGQRQDYDDWAAAGNPGWAFDDVEACFRRAESGPDAAVYGSDGPLPVHYVEHEFDICHAFIAAAQQAGHPLNAEMNGVEQAGVSYFPATIERGRRITAAGAYLKSAAANLTVMTGVRVDRVVIRSGRAVALECQGPDGAIELGVGSEVILCGGAINSPQLLELSGVGDSARLQELGIEPQVSLPGVGENLHDHWNGYIQQGISSGASYYSEAKGVRMLYNMLRYLLRRRGFLGYPAALVAVFYRALEEASRADAQIHFSPAASERDSRGNMVPIDAVTVASCGIRPRSRGHSHIVSADAGTAPAIQVNYLQHEADRRTAVAAFKKARQILAADAYAPHRGDEIAPGTAVTSDEDILQHICEQGDPVHHLAGSCRMGSDDMAVVDAGLRVRGVAGLRIADASIMPAIVSGNTHAACVMIGEKAADLVLAG